MSIFTYSLFTLHYSLFTTDPMSIFGKVIVNSEYYSKLLIKYAQYFAHPIAKIKKGSIMGLVKAEKT